jgi:hypothetical protein
MEDLMHFHLYLQGRIPQIAYHSGQNGAERKGVKNEVLVIA